MIRRILCCAALLGGLGLSVPPARAADLIAVDDANPPFMYMADGKAAGIYPALLREAYRRLGEPVQLVAMPWKRALAGTDAGQNGTGGLYRTAERLAKYDYSDKLFDEVILVYVATGVPFAFTGIESLYGRTVGVIRGWSYGDDFDNAVKAGRIKTDETASDPQNMAKLAAHRLDAVLAIREAGQAVIAASGLSAKVQALAPPLSANPSYVAFAKTRDHRSLLERFNAALAAMRADGTYDKILSVILTPPS